MPKNLLDTFFIEEDIPEEYLYTLQLPEHEFSYENLNIYANPRITAVTTKHVYGWERCASFPGAEACVSRPVGVRLSYQNELGDYIEKSTYP